MKLRLLYFFVAICCMLTGINTFLLLNTENVLNNAINDMPQNEERVSHIDEQLSNEPMKAIDLGLSVYWASCNLGAESPEAFGNFFRWGEIEATSFYDGEDWGAYKYCDGRESCISYNLGASISSTQYDAAYAKSRGIWRMPTIDEIEELLQNCNCTWRDYRGTKGVWASSPNGNSIFLPEIQKGTMWIYYWTSTQNPNKDEEAYCLEGRDNNTIRVGSIDRCRTILIRPVKDK